MTKAETTPKSERMGLLRQSPAQSSALSFSTRVDAPHEMGGSASGEVSKVGISGKAAPSDVSPDEKLYLQAYQLGAYLRGRQKELDAREAALNSRLAGCESEARAARLWIEQRQAELTAAEESLAGQRRGLDTRAAALGELEEEAARRSRDAEEREQALAGRERELAARERLFEERLERLAAAEFARDRNEQEAAERCGEAQRQAEAAERLAAERRRAEAELERKRRAVQRRAEHVDRCRASLRQLREELGRMHRETLEVRLATEELWVQLSGAAPPAALTRSLGRIRTRLAEQYAQANAELAGRKKELEAIRGRLESRHKQLLEQKRLFEQWAAAKQQECETQAARLVAREEQLQREEDRLREEAGRRRAEQAKFRQELRRWKAMRSTRPQAAAQ